MANFILSAAIRAVKSRIGTWNAYDSISELVPEVSKEQWAAAIGEARAALAQRVSEATRPLNRRPTADEFGPTLVRNSGARYWQTVEVFIRDQATGARSVYHVTVKTDTLRSRLAVVNEAIDTLQSRIDGAPEDYPVDIVGFAYTGTYQISRG
jgi:hypothetical protein